MAHNLLRKRSVTFTVRFKLVHFCYLFCHKLVTWAFAFDIDKLTASCEALLAEVWNVCTILMNELEWIYVKQDLKLEWAYILLEIKPCGLGSRIRNVEAFWYETEIIYFVRLCWLCVIVWFTLTLTFWYLKLKNWLFFFLRLEADFFILCYHARCLH